MSARPRKHYAPWTTSELAWLKANYRQLGREACAARLDRSGPAVREQARKLGLPPKRTPRGKYAHWTRRELAWLDRHYEELGEHGCAVVLNRHTPMAIRVRANRRGHYRRAEGVKATMNEIGRKIEQEIERLDRKVGGSAADRNTKETTDAR